MPQLKLKSSHKAIRDYYATLKQYEQHDITHEGAVSNPFAFLLDACAKQVDATLVPQYPMRTPAGNRIVLDGVILDAYRIPFAYWEAKDMDDNLYRAVQEKRDAGYPFDNIFFQTPTSSRNASSEPSSITPTSHAVISSHARLRTSLRYSSETHSVETSFSVH